MAEVLDIGIKNGAALVGREIVLSDVEGNEVFRSRVVAGDNESLTIEDDAPALDGIFQATFEG
jgi:hypothetical protein